MSVLRNESVFVQMASSSTVEEKFSPDTGANFTTDGIELNYFDLLDETPEFSEAAILLEDNVIEYCYVKNGKDGRHYFGFDRCSPGAEEYDQIIARHKLEKKMEANTFESYPSGKTVLSRRGKIIEVNYPRSRAVYG
jgi:hypothetical protein